MTNSYRKVRRLLEVDKFLALPVSTIIRVNVTSKDVIHSWAVPSLGIKVDAVPGRINSTNIILNFRGDFYGQCSEICGVNHGFMPIHIKGVSQSEFYSVVNEEGLANKRCLNKNDFRLLPKGSSFHTELEVLRGMYLTSVDSRFDNEIYKPWTNRMKIFLIHQDFLRKSFLPENLNEEYLLFIHMLADEDILCKFYRWEIKISGEPQGLLNLYDRHSLWVQDLRRSSEGEDGDALLPSLDLVTDSVQFNVDMGFAEGVREELWDDLMCQVSPLLHNHNPVLLVHFFKAIAPTFCYEYVAYDELLEEASNAPELFPQSPPYMLTLSPSVQGSKSRIRCIWD
jgi:hypothetical protein